MGMGAPVHEGSSCGVIIRIIMGGHAGIQSFTEIPTIFSIQGIALIFQMSCHENLTVIARFHHGYSSLTRFRQNFQFRNSCDIPGENFRMSGMRRMKHVVKPSEQATGRPQHPVFKIPESFTGKLYFGMS